MAQHYLERALAANSPHALLARALELEESGDWAGALGVYEQAAGYGIGEAQVRASFLYATLGNAQDRARAFHWYSRSKRISAESMRVLGCSHEPNRPVARVLARSMLRRAALMGSFEAVSHLAEFEERRLSNADRRLGREECTAESYAKLLDQRSAAWARRVVMRLERCLEGVGQRRWAAQRSNLES